MVLAKEYGIWLSFNNQQEGFELPILPGEIGSAYGGDSSERDVFGLGKINVIKDRKLAKYQIESLFPARPYPFITATVLLEPRTYVDMIMRWWDSKRPIRFVAVTETMDINTPASIESFEWREVSGSPGDIQYALQLKEYKFYAARLLQPVVQRPEAQVASASAEPRPDDRVQPKTYTMVAGDTLWSVAKRYLGDGSRWREIQTLNGITDAEIKRLPVGKVLKLP